MWFKVTVFSEKVSPLLASQNFTRVFCLSGNDGKRPDHKIQQIPANLRIHDCRSNIMFNRSFYSSLRSRRLEVVGARKNERARGRHARGEGEPARKAHARVVSRPQSSWQPLRDLSKLFDRKRVTSHKQSVPTKSVVHFIVLKIANPLFSLRDFNLTLGLTPPRRHVVWRRWRNMKTTYWLTFFLCSAVNFSLGSLSANWKYPHSQNASWKILQLWA